MDKILNRDHGWNGGLVNAAEVERNVFWGFGDHKVF
jgi:hypothetical protein